MHTVYICSEESWFDDDFCNCTVAEAGKVGSHVLSRPIASPKQNRVTTYRVGQMYTGNCDLGLDLDAFESAVLVVAWSEELCYSINIHTTSSVTVRGFTV